MLFERNSIALSGDWAVSALSPTALAVSVAEGRGTILGNSISYQGLYACDSQGSVLLPLATADATNPRIDTIIARVRDNTITPGADSFVFEVVTGTPAGSPSAPADPASSYRLATVAVAANATVITAGNITDTRVTTSAGRLAATSGLIVCTSTTRPTGPARGMRIFETDTGSTLTYYGTTTLWQQPWNQPWGRINTATISTVQGPITTIVDLTGLTITIASPGNRYYRASWFVAMSGTTLGNLFDILLADSSNVTLVGGFLRSPVNVITSVCGYSLSTGQLSVGAAGNYTMKLRAQIASGAGSVSTGGTTFAGTIFVEDIGPNGSAPAS